MHCGQAPEAFSSSEMNLYRYCHNDPVNNSDPFGLEFFPGEFVEVDSITGKFGQTLSNPHITFKVVPTEGGFRPQMKVDVIVHRKEIATHAQGHLRSERAKEATKDHENKHEGQQKQWHDKNQDSGPKGPFPNKDSAEKAGSDKANSLRKDFYNNVNQNDRHQPDKEWKGILEREKDRH